MDTNGIVTKLCIFDFDGTLIDTELPERGKEIWKEVTNTEWPHIGWWGKKESLDMTVFENPVVPEVGEAYKVDSADPKNYMVMLTGRMAKLHNEVELILRKHNLTFDENIYNTGGDTFGNKVKHLERLLNELPNVTEILMYEDRAPHIEKFNNLFMQWVSEGKIESYNIIKIDTNHF
ncbi:MAG: hypothetical protein KAH32_05235 [Chlamydiia bacterium]|nr:hypothetical protein [Chlamydiia bacterium]